jgi:23S rRNA pseudouridine2605 synthase
MRLQVFLSHNGVCSRRDAMDIIQAGRVKVNDRIVKEPSTPV